MPNAKEISDMLDIGPKPSQVISVVFLHRRIAKDKCSHCVMGLDYCFRWVLTALLHRIIALWVHPLNLLQLNVQ